jgi:RNA polymerase sigma-70 factor (ECF subfamily)
MPEPPSTRRRERHAALFAEHHDAVWRYAVRRVGAAAAEDVVAETFLVAWRRIDAVPAHELPWLLTVARNVVSNQTRGELRRRRLTLRLTREFEAAADEPAREPTVPAGTVAAALATLSERDQEALRLVYWEDLEPAAAARVLGCTAVAMRVRLHRARARLARALDQQQLAEDPRRSTPLTPKEAR